jgi:hypothetical protein
MAQALDVLFDDRALAERMGQRAEVDAREHTWERAVAALLRGAGDL